MGVGIVERLRQPAYTGLNRCWPCTLVNSLILGAVSLALALVVATRYGIVPAVAVESGLLAVGGSAIYLRGYLIPGTPTLTTRYAPEWFLDLFGKTDVDRGEVDVTDSGDDDPVEIERLLVGTGLLTECRDGDLCLSDEGQSAWHERIERARSADDDGTETLLAALDVTSTDVEYDTGGTTVRLRVEGQQVGEWESRAAYVADAAAAPIVAERSPEWDEFPPLQRLELLAGLRLFLETCPSCDGPVSFAAERVESCCSSRDVAAITCDECDARVFETEPGAAALTL